MQPVLIVAHGQPSDPAPAAADLARLAAVVGRMLPDHRVGSATLAEAGGLDKALAQAGDGGMIYPMFMAGGWFARVHLPAQLAAADAKSWQVLEPFGCDPAVHDLAVDLVSEAIGAGDEVLVAAHGSFKSSIPSDVANHMASHLRTRMALSRVEVAFIDQAPQLSQVHGFSSLAVCLPFFAAAGDHVTRDVPAALRAAGFRGRILPSLGMHARVPALVAAAIRRSQSVCTAECRFRR